LVFQQNRSKIQEFIKDGILNAVREGIPVEKLLRAYLDETTDLIKEIPKEEKKGLSFSDKDNAITVDNEPLVIDAPKDLETLEKISEARNIARKLEEEEEKVKISDEIVTIDIEDLGPKEKKEPEIDLGIEILS